MVNAHLSPSDQAKVDAAVAEAQSRTHARFAFVVVPASDRYHLYPVIWGAIAALTAFGILAILRPFLPLPLAFALVIAVFLVASLVLEWRPLRLLVVPRRIKHEHARALAHREFAVRILSHPEHKGGVLFFVSLAEHYTEIVADFVTRARQGDLADGFVAGAQTCGALLATHHPKT